MFQLKQKNFLLGLILLCASSVSNAELVSGNVGAITQLIASTVNQGDFIITTDTPLQNCDGFFVYGEDAGAKYVFATLQIAYLTKRKLQIWAYDHQLWEGSSSRYCKISSIGYIQED